MNVNLIIITHMFVDDVSAAFLLEKKFPLFLKVLGNYFLSVEKLSTYTLIISQNNQYFTTARKGHK